MEQLSLSLEWIKQIVILLGTALKGVELYKTLQNGLKPSKRKSRKH
jgi:hypothetical protein